jgi:hypothetical protein
VKRLFREIIDHSVRLQQEYFSTSGDPNGAPRRTIVVAFQGGEGAYSHLAATRHFGARDAKVIYEGFPSFKAMLEAVKNGMADYTPCCPSRTASPGPSTRTTTCSPRWTCTWWAKRCSAWSTA